MYLYVGPYTVIYVFSLQADAIVNTASSDLDLSRNACAKSLSAMAGPSLQQECSTKGPVNVGDMAVTGGGNLKCKHVFHVVCDGWNGGEGEQVKSVLFYIIVRLLPSAKIFCLPWKR